MFNVCSWVISEIVWGIDPLNLLFCNCKLLRLQDNAARASPMVSFKSPQVLPLSEPTSCVKKQWAEWSSDKEHARVNRTIGGCHKCKNDKVGLFHYMKRTLLYSRESAVTWPTVQSPHTEVSRESIGHKVLVRQHVTPCQQHHSGTEAVKPPWDAVQFPYSP